MPARYFTGRPQQQVGVVIDLSERSNESSSARLDEPRERREMSECLESNGRFVGLVDGYLADVDGVVRYSFYAVPDGA